ncbi:MAG: hypothetical protein BZY80_02135 [SAR202 cluster bacterium Io17-Chloro-G2]|nr:MAG: hypothetical protein BZY80_02135 [SAR202 cluster bacterium Io17-Chloro-G2]
MTTPRQLYSLQEFDLALDRIDSEKADAETELGSGGGAVAVETALESEQQTLEEVRTMHREQQADAEGQRQRSTELDRQLYDGEITDPQVLEDLQREANNVRNLLQDRDTRLMELSLKAEESRNRCSELEQRIAEIHTAWETRSAQLNKIIDELAPQREAVWAERGVLAQTLEPVSLQKYEMLRKAKGGTAVAKVERGLCQACRMSLPTRQHQQVKSGRQTVNCSSCGRILCQG